MSQTCGYPGPSLAPGTFPLCSVERTTPCGVQIQPMANPTCYVSQPILLVLHVCAMKPNCSKRWKTKIPPFRLPVPLKATSGDIIVRFEHEQGTETIATLSPLLPGHLHDRPPERNDPL